MKVIETPTGWMIKCPACGSHDYPKKPLANGSKWAFNGDMERPSFSPSMNESVNQPTMAEYKPEYPSRRCHFFVADGSIIFCGDCTHELKGQTFQLEDWPEAKVEYYKKLMESR